MKLFIWKRELSRRGESDYHFPSSYQEFDCGCVIYGQPTNGFVISEMFEKVFKIKDNQLITLISNGETKVGSGRPRKYKSQYYFRNNTPLLIY